MSENMSISVNGQSQVPPGFRFHPTEEELLQYYLRKKVSYEKIELDVIRDVDLNKLEPWEIQEKCKIGTTPQSDWYFFSRKDRKYPTGTRTNRATTVGFWKATGRDKVIYSNGKRIGMRKTLVFYKGRAPQGLRSDWIMHEYRLEDNIASETAIVSNVMGDAAQEEGWVVCKIFKKKNHLKSLEIPLASSNIAGRSPLLDSCQDTDEGDLEQRERDDKDENYNSGRSKDFKNMMPSHHDKFLKLPKSTSMEESQQNNYNNNNGYDPTIPVEMVTEKGSFTTHHANGGVVDPSLVYPVGASTAMVTGRGGCLADWATLDGLVASQLNDQTEAYRQLGYFNDPTMGFCTGAHGLQLPTLAPSSSYSSSTPTHSRAATYISPPQDYTGEIDLWNFA